MIFNLTSLPTNDHLSTLLHPSKPYNPYKLATWWAQLSMEEQTQICSIDTPEIISDLLETITSALLMTKLQPKHKDKPLVALKKLQDSEETQYLYNYQFELEGTKIMHDDLAILLSAFSLLTNDKPQKNGLSMLSKELKKAEKGVVCVRKTFLGPFMDLLRNTVLEFGQGQKQTFSQEHSVHFYSYFVKNGPKKMSFEGVESFTIEQLFYKLIAVTLVLENNIYLTYAQKVSQEALPKLMVTSKAFYTEPAPSQLDLDNIVPSLMKIPSPALSTASTSADSLRDATVMSLTSTRTASFKPVTPKAEKEEALPADSKKGSLEGLYNPYEGFYIGDLEMTFEPAEAYFTDFSRKHENGKGNLCSHWKNVKMVKPVPAPKMPKNERKQQNNPMNFQKKGSFKGLLGNGLARIPII